MSNDGELAVITPKVRYQQDVQEAGFVQDPAQEAAIEALTDLHAQLLATPSAPAAKGRVRRLLRKRSASTAVPGLYLWGGVGRGKTYLMDLFYECLPPEQRRRLHFHRFMKAAHARLRTLRDQEDPLNLLAKEWASEARVLCFDEFFVSDIADAMILSGLLHGLVESGVTLVATSNVPPADLYADGLQRERFLPAIALLEEHTELLNVDGGVDYRLRLLSRAPVYYAPANAKTDEHLAKTFEALSPKREHTAPVIEINGREIKARGVGDGVLYASFNALCQSPRSADDYIELAKQFHTVLLANVPIMDHDCDDAARRFIALVDEFYDRSVKLIISASAEIDLLYRGYRLDFEFRRTLSRLQEMQSHDYLALAHRP